METQKNLLQVIGDWLAMRQTQKPTEQSYSSRLRRFLRWLTPNGGTLLLVVVLILTQNVWAKRATAPSAPGPSATTVNYQGRLADHGGTPLDGTYGMSFALYDAATGGTLIWGPESHTAVPVSNGLFSVGLGSQTSGGIPTTVWDGDRYLEITVGGETLSPRELIRSVPIAGMALTVPDGSITSNKVADGTIMRDDRAPWYQVTAQGDHDATATCPSGTTILFGWKLHMTTDGMASGTGWGTCTPGETECSISTSDTHGDDEVRIWMVCE